MTKLSLWMLFILLILTALVLAYPRWHKKIILKRWRRRLSLDHHYQQYQTLFEPINGFEISKQARAHRDAMEYTYGEIEFLPFIALLSLTNPTTESIFYDLGSGTGKAVIAAAMVFPLKKSCGIELFNPLHDAACQQQQKLMLIPEYQQAASHVVFIQDTFLNANFQDATHLFIQLKGRNISNRPPGPGQATIVPRCSVMM